MNKKNLQYFLQHPISSSLLLLYLIISVIQGNLELFLAGVLAAAGAYGLEFMFHVTGAIGMRPGRGGCPAPVPIRSEKMKQRK